MPKRYKVLSAHLLESTAFRQRVERAIDRSGCSDGRCPGCQLRIGCCYEYCGSRAKSGYGRFHYRGDGQDVTYYVHRLVWAFGNRQDPGEKEVQHRCDNPPCVRMEHLKLGDELANARDKVFHGRQYRGGPKNPKTGVRDGQKLSLQDRETICRLYRTGAASITSLAEQFDVTYSWVYQLVKPFRSDRHRRSVRFQNELRRRRSRGKFTSEQVQRIKCLYATREYTQEDIGRLYGVSKSAICLLLRGKTYSPLKLESQVVRGEDHFKSTLSERRVRRIRKLYATGKFTQQELAEKFATTQTTVSAIVRGFTWKHLL